MTDKVLVIILSGEDDPRRVEKGLTFAMKSKKLGMLNDVKVLLWGPGVDILKSQQFDGFIKDLKSEGVIVSACVSDIKRSGLDSEISKEAVKAAGAAVFISDSVMDGYQVITF